MSACCGCIVRPLFLIGPKAVLRLQPAQCTTPCTLYVEWDKLRCGPPAADNIGMLSYVVVMLVGGMSSLPDDLSVWLRNWLVYMLP